MKEQKNTRLMMKEEGKKGKKTKKNSSNEILIAYRMCRTICITEEIIHGVQKK